jgi:hypothetical protein
MLAEDKQRAFYMHDVLVSRSLREIFCKYDSPQRLERSCMNHKLKARLLHLAD